MKPLGRSTIPGDDRLVMHFPGGGGFGDPADRDVTDATAERRDGMVTD